MAVVSLVISLLISSALANQFPNDPNEHHSGVFIKTESHSLIDLTPRQVKFLRDESVVSTFNDSPREGKSDTDGSWCEHPFEPVNGKCYLFSEIQLSFSEAETYCSTLSSGHSHEIELAMLNSGFADDEALLKAATSKNMSFFIGGKADNGLNWTWLDGTDVDMEMPFWDRYEPDTQGNNCMITKIHSSRDSVRSYIEDNSCDKQLNFVCQVGHLLCPLGFRRVGENCYFSSEEIGLPHVLWQEARDYCLELTVPEGHFADLAVLDLSDYDGGRLMNNLAAGNEHTWVGLYEDVNCDYWWVNGLSQSLTTNYWYPGNPVCGNGQSDGRLYHFSSSNRTYICSTSSTSELPFVCQMFSTSTN